MSCEGVIAGIFAIIRGTEKTIVSLFFAAIMGLFCYLSVQWIIDHIKSIKQCNAQIKQFKNGILNEDVIQEFKNAEDYCNGTLRMSPHYVFGKHTGLVLNYDSIDRAYQHISFVNDKEQKRGIRVKTKSGQIFDIGKLKRKGKSDDELQMILQNLLMKNNMINIGYTEDEFSEKEYFYESSVYN